MDIIYLKTNQDGKRLERTRFHMETEYEFQKWLHEVAQKLGSAVYESGFSGAQYLVDSEKNCHYYRVGRSQESY